MCSENSFKKNKNAKKRDSFLRVIISIKEDLFNILRNYNSN